MSAGDLKQGLGREPGGSCAGLCLGGGVERGGGPRGELGLAGRELLAGGALLSGAHPSRFVGRGAADV